MADFEISAGTLARHIVVTVRVRGLRTWRARWWLAALLIHVAAWVAGCTIVVETEPAP
jgi:hypothetical protein